MRIGIDCRAIQGRGGIAHYTYNLVKNLLAQDKKNEYVLFFDPRKNRNLTKRPEQQNCSVRFFPAGRMRFIPLLYSHLVCGHFLNRQNLDLLHTPTTFYPLGYRGPLCVTVHDLIIFSHPEWFPRGQWFSRRIVVPSALQRAQRIIAVSQDTKREIERIFQIGPRKIMVIYEGGLNKRCKTIQKVQNHLIFIGTLEPRKNLERLFKAFALYCRQNPQASEKLYIVGAKGWKFQYIYRSEAKFKLSSRVIFTGFLSEERKIELLQKAKALVLPSLYEGFGLPVLEAMELGIPVICSRRGGLAEVGGDAVFYIDPSDSRSIFHGLERVLKSEILRAKLRQKGIKQAQKFSWRKCARKTRKVYEKIVNS